MPDAGTKETDRIMAGLQKRIEREYKQAGDEAQKKLDKYLSGFERKDEQKKRDLEDGKITEAEYKQWRTGQILTGERWKELRNNLAKDYTNANVSAMKMTSDAMLDVYAANFNYGTYEAEKGAGMSTMFTIYDRDTVDKLLKENPKLLPRPKVDIPKDLVWNAQHLTSAITQGLLQGEPIDKIAKRLDLLTEMGKRAALRNARTMTTAAQNAGRIESYKRAEDMGIEMQKMWLAEMDDRVRDSHAELNGETVGVDEEFSNGLQYPADPNGEPEEVYNCRCTLIAQVKGHEHDVGREDESLQDMSYEEWTESLEAPQPPDGVVEGSDISETWERRPDEFDFEIEDVINAQGFDGLPRVVSEDEFNKCVQEANDGNGFIAQRTYSAPDQETLDAYRQQLYEGNWYVDCSVGGAQYGQGMYCAADYTGELSTGIKMEMNHYRDLGESRYETYFDAGTAREQKYEMAIKEGDSIIANGGSNEEARKAYDAIMDIPDREWAEKYAPELLPTKGVSYTETFTLDPSAKIITYDELRNIQNNYDEYLVREAVKNVPDKYAGAADFYRYVIEDKIIGVDDDHDIGKEAKAWWSSLSDKERYEFKEVQKQITQYANDKAYEMRELDSGAFAVLLGYDAINSEGHGGSGSYTVILNRTKLIILGE